VVKFILTFTRSHEGLDMPMCKDDWNFSGAQEALPAATNDSYSCQRQQNTAVLVGSVAA